MQENKKRDSKENKNQKDYYIPVMACQIVLSLLFLLVLFAVVSSDGSGKVKKDVSDIMSSEIQYEDVSAAVSHYLNQADSWAVFGDSVSYSEITSTGTGTTETAQQETTASETASAEKSFETTEENTQESSQEATEKETTESSADSVGGVDLKTYEAKQNTSFAPYTVTAKILNPIENGRYTSYFGYRTNPITGEFSFHTGLDIAAANGTAIRAAWNGTVTRTGEDSQAGKYIFVEHDDGFVTFYCHCSEIVALKGTVIRQGETIARVGSTGWSTGPHLHFEIRKDNIRLNPLWALENDC